MPTKNKFSMTNDIVFKAVFGKDTDISKAILKDLLNTILSKSTHPLIEKISIKNPFIPGEYIEKKKPLLDIKAVLENGEQINIEVQTNKHKAFMKRMIYYLAKYHGEQLEEGEPYSHLGKTIQIQILNFTALKSQKPHTWYRLKGCNTNEELTDQLEVHCLQLPYVNDKIDVDKMDSLTAWLTIVKDLDNPVFIGKVNEIMGQKEVIGLAIKEYHKITKDKMIREQIESYEKAERDHISFLAEAKEEAKEEGIKEATVQIAKKMLEQKMDIELIMQTTGLSKEDIKQFQPNSD